MAVFKVGMLIIAGITALAAVAERDRTNRITFATMFRDAGILFIAANALEVAARFVA